MENTLIKFKVDKTIKMKAFIICKKLGIDIQTYLRICLIKLVDNNGIPFDLILKNRESKGLDSLLKMNNISKDYNNTEMTLDKINFEINEIRK